MGTLLLILIPILIADIINPILFAAVLYGLGTSHPMRNTGYILLSFFLSYFLCGIALALGLDALGEFLHIARSFDYAIEFAVGILLLSIGCSKVRAGDIYPEEQLTLASHMNLKKATVLGLQVNFIGLPFALPYLAAIDQILKADLSATASITLLFFYNVLYIAPFLAMMAIQKLYDEESRPILASINGWIHRISVKWLPWVFILLGLALLEDCISYYLGYREYSFLSLY